MGKCSDNFACDRLEAPQRNNYFYGELLDEAKLRREQNYLNQKRWMLNRLSLGKGVLCGLTVTHTDDRVCISPGVAIDGCGREIVVPEPIQIDPWQTTDDSGKPAARLVDGGEHEVFLCLTYIECPADFTPVLVTDCDSSNRTAPATIMEKYAIIVKDLVSAAPAALSSTFDPNLCTALADADPGTRREGVCGVLSSRACADSDSPSCVTIVSTVTLTEGKITSLDVCSARPVVYSNPELFEMLQCRSEGGSGSPGPVGPPGPGIDSVSVTKLPCDNDPTAQISGSAPNRILSLGIPLGCDGAPGQDGAGISQVEVNMLSCEQTPTATLRPDPASVPNQILTLGIPGQCDQSLTKIAALNWVHDGEKTAMDFLANGLEITFSSPDVVASQLAPVSANGWFQVSAEVWGGTVRRSGLWMALGAAPNLIPWWVSSGLTLGAPGSIPALRVHGDVTLVGDRAFFKPHGMPYDIPPISNLPWQYCSPEFYMTLYWLNLLFGDAHVAIRVKVKSDFLLDKNGDFSKGARAVDGNHIGGRLPTGDGIQGGDFESWFRLTDLGKISPPRKSAASVAKKGAKAIAELDMLTKAIPDISALEKLIRKGG